VSGTPRHSTGFVLSLSLCTLPDLAKQVYSSQLRSFRRCLVYTLLSIIRHQQLPLDVVVTPGIAKMKVRHPAQARSSQYLTSDCASCR
ncbi:hypothetical protein B0H13DRAFT_2141836, partial [Mycena leptocephala]